MKSIETSIEAISPVILRLKTNGMVNDIFVLKSDARISHTPVTTHVGNLLRVRVKTLSEGNKTETISYGEEFGLTDIKGNIIQTVNISHYGDKVFLYEKDIVTLFMIIERKYRYERSGMLEPHYHPLNIELYKDNDIEEGVGEYTLTFSIPYVDLNVEVFHCYADRDYHTIKITKGGMSKYSFEVEGRPSFDTLKKLVDEWVDENGIGK